MNVLMLGWEYPPNIAGGLGVACEGLTKAISQRDTDILFVLPKLLGGEQAPHMRLTDSFAAMPASTVSQQSEYKVTGSRDKAATVSHVSSCYSQAAHTESAPSWLSDVVRLSNLAFLSEEFDSESHINRQAHYGNNIFDEVARYTARVVKRFVGASYDLIHAHDWMTYAAGVALAKASGKPLVVHLHSSEYDRSGSGRNPQIHAIEMMGLHEATAVIAVSQYTKSVLNEHYGVPNEKITVVHNGIYPKVITQQYIKKRAKKSVLFLGRVTLQKGPDYYLQAAAKVLSHLPDVEFVLAGTGDMLPRLVEQVHAMGIQDNFHFAGFLSGVQIERAFLDADLYVMPSVSEPFGISALEAINFDTPVLMSKQSGAGEVLRHSLKFDFWDIDRFADLIINGLMHNSLRDDLVRSAKVELEQLRWDAAAEKTRQVYQTVAVV